MPNEAMVQKALCQIDESLQTSTGGRERLGGYDQEKKRWWINECVRGSGELFWDFGWVAGQSNHHSRGGQHCVLVRSGGKDLARTATYPKGYGKRVQSLHKLLMDGAIYDFNVDFWHFLTTHIIDW